MFLLAVSVPLMHTSTLTSNNVARKTHVHSQRAQLISLNIMRSRPSSMLVEMYVQGTASNVHIAELKVASDDNGSPSHYDKIE